jgi:surface antigen
MFRALVLGTALVVTSLTAPLPMVSTAAIAQSLTGEQCQRRNDGRRAGGAAIGAIGRGILGRFGGGGAAALLPMASMLGDTIMRMLDCQEQEKAAEATEQVIERASASRGTAAVGTTQTWQSESRPGVTGSSTITAVEPNASDGDCMTVTDIVIVDGQETRAPKRMCRRPPSNRYQRVA